MSKSFFDEPLSIDDRLIMALLALKKDKCPECSRTVDRGDLAWSTGDTETGTPTSTVWIICQECDSQVLGIATWAIVETFEDAVETIEGHEPGAREVKVTIHHDNE